MTIICKFIFNLHKIYSVFMYTVCIVTHNFIIMNSTQNFKHNYVNKISLSLSKYREIKKLFI